MKFFQKRHTNGQQTNENMLNIPNYQRNAHQTYNEVSPHPSENQSSSVAQSCWTLYNPMDCSMPGFPVHHQLHELAQTHVHRVSDAMQPSHPLSFPSLPPAIFHSIMSFPVSKFFTSGGRGTGVSASASVLPMNIQD